MHCATPSVPASRSGLIRGPNESKRHWPGHARPYVPSLARSLAHEFLNLAQSEVHDFGQRPHFGAPQRPVSDGVLVHDRQCSGLVQIGRFSVGRPLVLAGQHF